MHKPVGWKDEPQRHGLAARGIRTSGMTAKAVYTHKLPGKVQTMRYRYRSDEFIKDIKEREYYKNPIPFAIWLVENTHEDDFYDHHALWFDVFDDAGVNVMMPVYDMFGDYVIIGYIGTRDDILKLMEIIVSENPGDKEAMRAFDVVSTSELSGDTEIFYVTTDGESLDETEFLMGRWDIYTNEDPNRLLLAEGGMEEQESRIFGMYASTRRDYDDKDDDEDIKKIIGLED